MKGRKLGALCLIAASVVALSVTASATATPPTPVTISNSVTFVPNAVDPFTSTGGVVCAAGTVSTPLSLFTGFQSGFKAQILVGKHFVCSDGTFEVLLRVTLDFSSGETHGTWSVVSGTGAYTKLHGGGGINGTPIPSGIQDEYEGEMHID